ncbi:cytochrome C biogenesis protein DipZ [Sulfurimicrobium lacus]|uniref:Cytochrome C biogenesis protein DipZ n=1 Tax=Sulfurimicrobium lacus TaxID=2715678 RepID=A0A6F8VEL7_9PROT|nr:cytochrome c biogenesis protein DipZ [Sulfurimicrobium lacus]BCB27476.1 cytochrome C biogenesis protein DipZ [Sulfurimicrobium lacus]
MNFIDIGLAFLEGLALIVSPCILPVLPLVLAASVEGGRRRPYGIIIGFVLAFSLFALISRKIVVALGIDLDIVRDASLVLLAVFGLVLLSTRLSDKFSALTQGAANFGNQLASTGGEGLLSGVLIGALIGLVWTPCAGPILAAVLVQVIRQQSDFAGNLIIVSFAIGAGVPMLIIALTGRKIMNKLGFIARHTEAVRRGFGVLILLSVAYIASGVDAQSFFARSPNAQQQPAGELVLQHGLNKPYAAPEFAGNDAWLNSKPLTMQSLKGKVVLVDFWTYSCINCVRTLPYITDWDRKYRDQGLVIVGVHSPEFEFEKKIDNVKAAIAQHGIRYPVAMDNNLATWDNFNNSYWPAHYLIDKDGKVVYTSFGEGDYDVTENNIRYLLGLKSMAQAAPAQAPAIAPDQTPETYLGYDRAEHFAGKEHVALDAERAYRFPESLAGNQWALSGKWKVADEKIVAGEKGAALRLNFKARKVFLVLGTADGKPARVTIRLNGEALGSNAGKDASGGVATIQLNTLYELIDQKTPKTGLLEIQSDAPGVEAYAFTFG